MQNAAEHHNADLIVMDLSPTPLIGIVWRFSSIIAASCR
jgi:hypothetical protein